MLNSDLVLTKHEFEEWGNPQASPDDYFNLLSYTPYENIRPISSDCSPFASLPQQQQQQQQPHTFAPCPAVFCIGGLNDVRVGFWEPLKFVAKFREVAIGHDDEVEAGGEVSLARNNGKNSTLRNPPPAPKQPTAGRREQVGQHPRQAVALAQTHLGGHEYGNGENDSYKKAAKELAFLINQVEKSGCSD
mmetsp:Transcript_756/g.1430  ORF Transcript_756/g.1430 Transcript_756/m.1430 type:complete len:190 (+) Transcript_756:156-725(+)